MREILKDLSGFKEYVPGKGTDEVAREHGLAPDRMVKLASNENPLGGSSEAVEAVRDNADQVSVYPTALHEEMRERIADYVDVPSKNVVLGPGADGVFDTLGRALIGEGDEVLTPSPGFSYYGMSARYLGGKESNYHLSKPQNFEFSADKILNDYDGEKIVYVTTPNNPTGNTLPPSDLRKVASEVEGLVIVDEAYWEFSDTDSAVSLVADANEGGMENVVVARTFSKAFGLAGMRLGYGVVPDWLASAYRKVTTPFSVGTLALYAGMGALEDEEHLEKSVELARWGREYMSRNLDVPTFDSEANFVLVDVSPMNSTEVTQELEKRGIIVRDTTSFGLPECIRVSVGTKQQTKRAVEEINSVCG
ncbi:MAG: histidinol-phosphate transaminase [Halobacteria archaeon]|nr:histidinol-phosphate transaminase [Halobacteria archaeon]